MRKLIALLLAVVMVLSLAVTCAAEEHTSDVELTFWAVSKWNGIYGTEADGQTGDWERYMAEKFHEMYPNVTINVEVYDTKNGPAVMASAIAAETYPDIVHDANTRLMQYSNNGFLVPVTEYMTEEETATFAAGTFDSIRIADGNAYFVPYGTNVMAIMVNKTLFEQAGCADLLPQGEDRTWSFDEYYTAVSTACANLEGVYAAPLFADISSGGDMYTWCWIYAAGGKMFDETTNRMGVNCEETKTGLAFWKKIIDNGLAAPGGAALKAGDAAPLFYQQQVISCPCATVHYSRLVAGQANGTYADFDCEVYAVPHAEGVSTISCADPHGFAVWKGTDAEKVYWAEQFVKFLASDENAAFIKAAGEVSYKICAQNLYEGQDDNLVYMSTLMDKLVPSGSSIPGYTSCRFEVTPYYQQLYLGEIDIDTFCENVEEVCNDYLENYEP
ncbi:MAG: hypothetical protein CW338_01490 [Clostridiales bacterium]|nr:hypothetical protein [Clostridiales bacterium]